MTTDIDQDQLKYLLSRISSDTGSLTINFGYGDFTFEDQTALILKKQIAVQLNFLLESGAIASPLSLASDSTTKEGY